MFLAVVVAVLQWKPGQVQSAGLRENFTESFISSLRYARNSPRMRTVLFRDLAFALVISIVPALLPVIALKAAFGVLLSCVGIGWPPFSSC
jgi:Transmembrane secretion effector